MRLGVTMEPIRKQLSRVWVEAIGAGFVLTLVVGMFGSYAQHAKYLSGKQWKEFLSLGEELSLFEHWWVILLAVLSTMYMVPCFRGKTAVVNKMPHCE